MDISIGANDFDHTGKDNHSWNDIAGCTPKTRPQFGAKLVTQDMCASMVVQTINDLNQRTKSDCLQCS